MDYWRVECSQQLVCVVLSAWSVGFERFVQSSTTINKVSSVFREERNVFLSCVLYEVMP